jgi:hypothetical protein
VSPYRQPAEMPRGQRWGVTWWARLVVRIRHEWEDPCMAEMLGLVVAGATADQLRMHRLLTRKLRRMPAKHEAYRRRIQDLLVRLDELRRTLSAKTSR